MKDISVFIELAELGEFLVELREVEVRLFRGRLLGWRFTGN